MEMSTPGSVRATSSRYAVESASLTPAHMVAVPGGYSHQVSGTASSGAAALTLPTVSLRKATTKQFVQWNIAFNNITGVYGLTQVVNDGGPPQRSAIAGLNSSLSTTEVDERYGEALRQYQEENTKLFYAFASSINLDGEWQALDMEFIQESFVRDTIRDGNGLLSWFRAKHDIRAPEKQVRLRAELQATKFELNTSLTKLLKTFVDALSIWCKIGDNDKNDPVKLNTYYVLMLEKLPTKPPEANLVRVRVRLAEQVFANATQLNNVRATVEDLVNFAKALGINDANDRERDVLTVGGLPRLTAADNNCNYCDLFGCKAKNDIKLCPCLNAAVKIGDGSAFSRDMQCRYITGARLHIKENPTLTSLKSVKFHVEPPAGGYTTRPGGGRGGRGGDGGRGGGNRNGGRGAIRQATPIVSGIQDMLGGDDADGFNEWLESQMHEEHRMATPLFGNLFGGGGDGAGAAISSAVRDAIEEATNSAVDAAFSNITPTEGVASTPAHNAALTRLPPVTPVVNTALSELRAAASASGGGIPTTTSKSRGKTKKSDEDEKTATETIMEAGAKTLKQERLLRKKAEDNAIISVKQILISQVKKIAVAAHDKLSEFSFSQITAVILTFYFIVWPNLKPEMRVVLNRAYAKILNARDIFLSGVASRLVGITTTGILLSMRSPSTSSADDNDNNGSDPSATHGGAAPLNPIAVAVEPDSRATSSTTSSVTARDETSSRDSSPLSPIAESASENVLSSRELMESSLQTEVAGTVDESAKVIDASLVAAVEKSVKVFAAVKDEANTAKNQLDANRKCGEPCCPTHPGLPANVCLRECGRLWCSACCAAHGVSDADMCTAEKCSSRAFVEDPNVWAPGSIDYAHDLSQVGESNLVGVHTRKISEFALKEGMVMINSALIPSSAMLFDNGATLNCAKTAAGRLVGTFVQNSEGDINVGDAGSNLYSDGSYLHALEYIDSSGASVDTLYRYDDTPNVICNILSEAIEVYENGGSFLFNVASGRVWTTSGGMEMKLHMTMNGLGWCKALPITDPARVQALLRLKNVDLIASIPRSVVTCSTVKSDINGSTEPGHLIRAGEGVTLSGASRDLNTISHPNPSLTSTHLSQEKSDANNDDDLPPLDLSSIVEIDSLATSIDMMHIIDPTFSSIDCKEDAPKHDVTAPTISVESSKDINDTYRTDALHILAIEDAPCYKDKAAFLVTVSDEIKKLSSDELASRLADVHMAEHRTCTSYAIRSDESTACAGDRVEQMVAQLDKLTGGKACALVAEKFNTLKAQYTLKQWDEIIAERTAWLTRLDPTSSSRKLGPFQSWDRYGLSTSRTTCKDWCCTSEEKATWRELDASVQRQLDRAAAAAATSLNSRVRVCKPSQSSPDCAKFGSRSAFTTSAKINPRSASQPQTSVDGSKI